MKNFILIITLAAFLSGCVTTRPAGNKPFDRIGTTQDVEGVYRNRGESGEDIPEVYLSNLIWDKGSITDHKSIEFIAVEIAKDRRIEIKALKDGHIVMEKSLAHGKNFNLRRGRIRLKRHVAIAGFKGGEVFLGPYYENTALGLDTQGNAKFSENAGGAGLIFLLIPFAFHAKREVRFIKIANKLEEMK